MDDARIVAGTHAVEELLKANPESILELFVADNNKSNIAKFARSKGVTNIQTLPMRALDQKSQGLRHQGVLAITAAFPYAELDTLLKQDKKRSLIVLLDSLQDPHNFGAIVRSAAAFGATGVVIPKDRAVQVTPVVERASAGTTSLIPIARVTNLKRAMEQLKEAGFWLVGAGTRDGVSLRGFEWPEKTGLVIGAEGEGMRSGIEAALDFVVTIPIAVESLNASNAAAILMYAYT